MNSLTYLTRRCPRKCHYCSLRESKGVGKELNKEQWIRAFSILKELGVEFNLILGNETWLLGEDLLYIIQHNQVPYALYTTCPPDLFFHYARKFFTGGIDNLSCGIDYPLLYSYENNSDSQEYHPVQKSNDGWRGLLYSNIREFHRDEDGEISLQPTFPRLDRQGTVTVHKKNYQYLPEIVRDLHDNGVFCGVNFIHWNKDGGFDFFPTKKHLSGYLFETDKELRKLEEVINEVKKMRNTIQNFEMLDYSVDHIAGDMDWHCKGDPYGGPTIDSDGQLRCCGYRKGILTPQFSIFDLPERIDDWREAVRKDSLECPGCFWSYPWMYRYWEKDREFGKNVFVNHAGKHIDSNTWSKRMVE